MNNRKKKQAEEVIQLVKNKLIDQDVTVIEIMSWLKPVAVEDEVLLETDGLRLFYNPDNVISCYKERRLEQLEKRLLHILLHGILGDYSARETFPNKKVADLAMDIRVNNLIRALKDKTVNSDVLSYKSLYDLYCNRPRLFEKALRSIGNVSEDNHSIWDMPKLLKRIADEDGESVVNLNEEDQENLKRIWSNAANQMRSSSNSILGNILRDNDTSNNFGTDAGNMTDSYSGKEEAKGDYYEILKELFTVSEGYKEDEDTIDTIMYQYGLDNYEDVAFIEPADVQSRRKLGNLVIAMDTSGSCSGYIADQFVSETRAIISTLSRDVDFDGIYFIQADSKIQSEKYYDDIDEWNTDFDDEVSLYGFGGTSFIPVFNRCNELSDKGIKIDCLLYYTDGEGQFPNRKPDNYKTFLVMPDTDDEENGFIPDWIDKRVVLKGEF